MSLSKFIHLIIKKNHHSFLFEEVLGTFDLSLYPELNDVRLKFLFHCGVPRPSTESKFKKIDELMPSTSRLCERIVDRCRREDDVRQLALEKVSEVFSQHEHDEAVESLDVFLDAIGQSKTTELGPLAFFGCWADDHRIWSTLDASRLEQVFDLVPRNRAELTFNVDYDRGIVSEKNDVVVTFWGENLVISGRYELPDSEYLRGEWAVQLISRRQVLSFVEVDDSEGEFCFWLDTETAFNRYTSGLPLKIALVSEGEIYEEKRLRLHLCGSERPFFTLIEPSFDVVDAAASTDEVVPDFKLETSETVRVYLFSFDETKPNLLDLDGNQKQLVETGHRGIWRSGSDIDPMNETTGLIERRCEFGCFSSTVSFEATDIVRGEFTLEDELRVHVTGERTGRIKEVHGIFEGIRNEPYRFLGKLNSRSRRRSLLAADMTSERGWRPVLLDFCNFDYDSYGTIGDYVCHRGPVQEASFGHLEMPSRAIELLTEYASIRFNLIGNLKNHFELDQQTQEHPDYAVFPVFVAKHSQETEKLLKKYLQSYYKILEYVDQERLQLNWSQLFVLVYLDCVVNWEHSPMGNSVFLVGPWHPLTLSKRYMIQAELYARADQLEHKNNKLIRPLTVLMKGITGFRWLSGLHRNDKQLEPLFVIPSSDPGWHIAIKQDIGATVTREGVGSLERVLILIKKNLGLETTLEMGSTADLTRSGILGYIRAFPSRRSVGIRTPHGYSISDVISAIDRFLHEEDGATEIGKLLPGGVRIACVDRPDETDDIRWSDPPMLLYHQDDSRSFESDIFMLPPIHDLSISTATDHYRLPRGIGIKIGFLGTTYMAH